jgi:hypothetical protein
MARGTLVVTLGTLVVTRGTIVLTQGTFVALWVLQDVVAADGEHLRLHEQAHKGAIALWERLQKAVLQQYRHLQATNQSTNQSTNATNATNQPVSAWIVNVYTGKFKVNVRHLNKIIHEIYSKR